MSVPTQPSVLTVEQWNADPANAGYRMYITESGDTAIQYVGQTAEWQKVGPMPEQLAIASQVGTPTDTYGGVVTEMQDGASVSPGGPRTPEATAALNAPGVGRETPAEQWDLKYGLDQTGNEFAPKEQEGDPGLLRYLWMDNQMRRIAGDNGFDAGDLKPTNLISGALGGFGEALDQGRRRTVEALGDQAYNKMAGQETDRGLLGTLAAPALWGFEQLNKINLSGQTEGQIGEGGGFSDWLADPANEAQIKQIYENGYNGFSGGDALWEYFVSDKTTGQRAVLDIMNDPLTYLTLGAGEVAKLAKPASKAATKGLQAIGATPEVAEAIGKGVGTGLQKLPYITDPTELVFPALGKVAQKTGLSKVGASIAANPTLKKLNPLAETEASKLRTEISRGEDAVANLLRNISDDPNVRMAGQEVNELPVTLVDHPEQAGQLLIFDPNTNEYMAVDNDGLMRVVENLKRVSGQDYRFTLDNRQSNSLNVNLGEILFGVAPIRTVDQMLETTNWRQKGAAFERYVDLLISRLDKAGPVERQQIIDNLYRYANDLARGGSENGRVFTPQQGAVEAARRMDTYDAMLAKSGYTDAKQVIHGQMAEDLRQNALAFGYVRPQAPRESADLAARRAAAAAAAAPPPAAAAPAPRPQTLGEAGFTARHVPRPGFRNMFNGNTETYGMFVEGPDGEKYWMVATRRRGSGDPAVAWTPDDPAFDGDAVWHVYRADPDTGRITRDRLTGAGRGAPPVTRADAERAIIDDAIPPAAAPPPPPPTAATGTPSPTAATPAPRPAPERAPVLPQHEAVTRAFEERGFQVIPGDRERGANGEWWTFDNRGRATGGYRQSYQVIAPDGTVYEFSVFATSDNLLPPNQDLLSIRGSVVGEAKVSHPDGRYGTGEELLSRYGTRTFDSIIDLVGRVTSHAADNTRAAAPPAAAAAPSPAAAAPYTGALREATDETVTVGSVEFDPFPAGQARPVFLETPHGTITRVVLTNYQGQRVVVMMVWSDQFDSWVPVDRIGSVGFELAPNMASDELTTMMRNLSDQIDDAFEEIDEDLIDTLVPAWEADPEGAASILDSFIFGNAMAPGAQRPRMVNVINEEFSGRPGAAPAAPAAPPTREAAFRDLANGQRGEPEQAMLQIQSISPGLFGFLAEHVGDLTHRMAQQPYASAGTAWALEYVRPKVGRAIDALTSAYGYAREVAENDVNNFASMQARGGLPDGVTTLDQYRQLIRDAGQRYADLHRQLPVYNRAQQLARDAAVAHGEMRFDDELALLRELEGLYQNVDEWNRVAGSYDPNFEATPQAARGADAPAAETPPAPEPTRTEPRARGTFEENGFTAESNPATDIETSRSPSGGYVVRQGYRITGPDGRRYLMTGERTTPTDEGIDILNDRRTEWRGFIVEDDGTLLPIDMMTLPNARNRRSGGWTLSTVREHILNHNLRGDSRYTPGEAAARRVLGQGRARVDADGNPVRLTGTAESNGFTVRGGPDAEPREMDVSQTTQDQFGAYVTHQRVRVLAPDGTRWVLVGRRVTPDLRNAAPALDPDTVWIAHRYGDDGYSMYPVQADIPFDGANPRLQGYSYQTAMDILMNEAHHGDAMFGLGRVSPTIDPALIPDGVDPTAAQARQAARAAGAQQQGQPVSTYQGFEWQNERPALPGADGEPGWRDTALVADDELRDLDQSIGSETLGEFAVRTRRRLLEVRRAIDEQTAQNLDPMDDPRVAQFMDEYGPDGLGLIADPEDLRTMPDEIIDVVATAISRRQLEISKGVRNAAGQVVTKPVLGSMRLARALEKYDKITGFLKGSQLYNWANILPFATKQLVGNGNSITITHGVKGLKAYLSPKDWRRIYRRDVKGILSPEKSELDLMLEGYGLPVGNRIRQSTRTGSLGAVKLLQKEESQNALAKLLAPDELRVIGQIFDTSLRETVFKIYAKPKLVELKLAIRQHAFDQAQRFDVAVSRQELDAFFDMLERQHPSKGYSPATLRQQLMSTYEYLAVGNAPGRVDEWAERVARDYLGGKMGDSATGFDGLRAIKLGAEDEMERIGFRFEERNIDAVLNRLVFYHYWSSRAGLLYGREMLRKPALAVAYYRAMEGLKQEAERDNYPEWLRGWLQMMSSPAGFTTYLNPASTLNTMLTFAEAEFRDEGGSVSDLTTLGNWVDKSPVQVNPLLASIAYWAGALGSDAAMPNITGGFSSINKDALDLVNLFRTNVQGKPPLSQNFNITPMLQNRVANLITTWANNAGIDTNLVEKRNLNATQITNRNWFVQQVLMESDPELTPDEVALVASQIQDDVDNPVVIEAMKRAGRVPFQGVYSTDPMTEGGFGAVLGGFLNTQLSPFAQVTRPSLKVANQALRKQGREEGGVPQEMLNTAYLQNAVATQASPDDLRFEQVVDGYYDIGSENQQQAERLYQQIRDGKPQEAVLANGKLWSVEEIMAMTPDRRQDLARVALYDAGLWGELQTLWKTKDAYEAQHSELKDYWEFKDVALNTPGGVEAWARDMMQRNVDFRRYVEQEIRFNPSMKIPGKDRTKMLLGTAAYRAAMSIPGSIYETEQTGRNLGPYGPSIAGVIPGLTASQQAGLGIAGGGDSGSTSDSFEQYKTDVRKDIDNFAAMVEIMNQYDAQNGRREGTTVNQYVGRLLNGKEGGRLPSDVYDLIDETFGYVFPTKQTLKQYLIWMGDPTANPTGDGSVDLFLEWDSMERARRALGKPDAEGMADGALNRNTVYGNKRLVRAADGSGWSFVDASEADPGQPVPIRPVVTTSAPQLLLNPDNAYQTLAEVPPGLPLEVVTEQDGWVLVETPDGVQGWVQASQVMRAA